MKNFVNQALTVLALLISTQAFAAEEMLLVCNATHAFPTFALTVKSDSNGKFLSGDLLTQRDPQSRERHIVFSARDIFENNVAPMAYAFKQAHLGTLIEVSANSAMWGTTPQGEIKGLADIATSGEYPSNMEIEIACRISNN